MTCGIYKIENNINHKVYIGQSKNIEKRWSRHKIAEDNCSIHQAMKKYGVNNFSFTIIEECSQDDLNDREIYWIQYYDSYNKGYNETKGGEGSLGKTIKLTPNQVEEIQSLLIKGELTHQEIADKFSVSENMICGINTGYYWKNTELDYPLKKKQPNFTNYKVIEDSCGIKKQYYCVKCGASLKTSQALMCPSCANIAKRKVIVKNFLELF